ncbi:unnamed protein product [Trichobilharzia szidati]|nr:unnamed protein product [Trichobilharzia szidati]CAH8848615.1 unnamed protein product [Trichobilharzia szidati]
MMDLRTQEVHSGHFMVSNLEDSEDESENSVDLSPEDNPLSISKDVNDQPATKDKNRLIFENLASLFKYLEIAYIGKLTSPKWDQFRGLRFAIKNKIRLNNIIWREYHMQYVKKLKPVVVQFQTPVCENHSKAEAVVLEGKYWRRRISTLCREYGLWRVFAKNKLYGSHNKQIVQCANELLEGSDMCSYKFRDLPKNATSKLLEEIMMDIDENLDLFFEQPLTFPNPRDLPTLGNADIMQPGLQQLQPNRSLREDISSSMFQSSEPNLSFQNSKYSIPHDVYSFGYTWSHAAVYPDQSFEDKFISGVVHSNPVITHPAATPTENLSGEHFSIPSGPSFLSKDCNNETLLELTTNNREDRSFVTNNESGENDYHGRHPYRPSFPVTQKRHFVHQPKLAGQNQCGKLPVISQSKCGSSEEPVPSKSCVDKPFQAFSQYSETKQENSDRKNGSTLLNALLRGASGSQNLSSSGDYVGNPPVSQKPSNCLSPLLCNALKKPENYFNHSPGKHFYFKDQSAQSLQLKSDQTCYTDAKDLSISYNHSGFVFGDHPSLVPDTPIQNIHIPEINRANASDNVPVPVGDYNMPVNCSVTQNHESTLSNLEPIVTPHIQPMVSHSSVLPFSTHNLLVKNCKEESIDFSLCNHLIRNPSHYFINTDAVSHQNPVEVHTPFSGTSDNNVIRDPSLERRDPSVKSLDINSSVIQSVQGNSGFVADTQNVPTQNPQNSIVFFKGNGELPSLAIHRNLSASSSINFTFPNNNSGQYSFPNSSNQVSNMFFLPSNEHVHGSLDDSNSELETLVPGSWNEPQMFSHTMSIGPNEMEQSTEAMVTKDSSLNINKISSQSSIVENSASMRGRSNSAGNLFSLQNNHLNSCSVQGSAATTSSYGSTEVLSPMFTNHKGFLCTTSPSCSPPSVSEQNDQPGKPTIGNSSEERRRQSMQSGLQTLRQLLKMHSNVDNLAGGSRFSARRNINNFEGKCSGSGTYTSADTEIPNEKLPIGIQSSSGLDLGTDEQTISSANEIGGNGRASKAATLRSAAELIRRLRDERNLLEVQCTNLKGEVKALQSAISLCCEKLPSSGSSSLRSTSDPNSNAYYSEWFRAYVHKQTEVNWKFYVFSLIIGGIFKSYCTTTVTNSRDQFVRSVYGWLDTNCSLIQLRPAVMQALCTLGKTTSVLQEPNKLPEQSRISSIENLF